MRCTFCAEIISTPPEEINPFAESTEAALPDAEDIFATDAARELAARHGIDLAYIRGGSGAQGRITIADVRAAIAKRDEQARADYMPGQG
jgi:pyruvate/2-oxoglutarate dehydrogenase complex dihydrolipoamide acyltransferase (E2) component